MTDYSKDLKDSIERDVHQRISERMQTRGARKCTGGNHGVIWGVVILVVGVILLLDHLGFTAVGNLWRFWPVLMIVVGAINLGRPGTRPWGLFLLLAGILFQLDNLGIIHFNWAEFWPLLIIAAGGMMIWNAIESRRLVPNTAGNEPTINAAAVFGGIERRVTARDFRFGRISAVFGGVELDFHDADIDGDEAVLEVHTAFGGVEIRVPDNWQVDGRNQTLFGGFSDETHPTALDPSAPKRKTLIITGSTIFGGVEIKN
jgi:predicted membrane protein